MPVKFITAVHDALEQALYENEKVIVIGEGVPDPKGIFTSTIGLQETFGTHRVFDMPLSENALTGICLGAAVNGLKPILIHQRIDFALLAMDQMVNHAAKWHYMFNGLQSVPMVIRVIIGKGWGQGPQHSQALWGMLAQVPGIKIFLPVTAQEAKSMMLAAIDDPNPVLFVEHRWLHAIESHLVENFDEDLELPKVMQTGQHITLIGWSYSVVELLNVAQALFTIGVEAEVINLRVAQPKALTEVIASAQKTGQVIIHDLHSEQNAPAHTLAAKLYEAIQPNALNIKVLAQPNHPVPTTWHLAKDYYVEAPQILVQVALMLSLSANQIQKAQQQLSRPLKPDVPNQAFSGPF